jgi:hypothetical protein
MLLAPRIAPISDAEIGEQNSCSFAEYCSRDRGWGFVSAKDGSRGFFKGFLAVGYRRNFDSYLIYAFLIVPSNKSNLLFSLTLISPVNEFLLTLTLCKKCLDEKIF